MLYVECVSGVLASKVLFMVMRRCRSLLRCISWLCINVEIFFGDAQIMCVVSGAFTLKPFFGDEIHAVSGAFFYGNQFLLTSYTL